MTRLIEYIERKERGIIRIQNGIQKKEGEMDSGIQDLMERNQIATMKIQDGIVRKAEDMEQGVEELQNRLKRFAENW